MDRRKARKHRLRAAFNFVACKKVSGSLTPYQDDPVYLLYLRSPDFYDDVQAQTQCFQSFNLALISFLLLVRGSLGLSTSCCIVHHSMAQIDYQSPGFCFSISMLRDLRSLQHFYLKQL